MTYAYFNATYNENTGYEGPFDVINGKSDIRMTKQLPYNPENDLKVRIVKGTPVYGRRSDFKNVSNIFFYKYNCKVCGKEALTTRHPSKCKTEDGSMTCGQDIKGHSECKKTIDSIGLEIRHSKTKYTRNNPTLISDYIGWTERKLDENGNFIQQYKKNGRKDGYAVKTIFEHRVIMEEHLGRPLLPTESVHHINMNKKDNRLENLYLCNVSTHSKAHGSINPIVETLMQTGIIGFNKDIGKYYLTTNEKENAHV
jgi:hypothetical protein